MKRNFTKHNSMENIPTENSPAKSMLQKYHLFPALLSLFVFFCVMLYFWLGLLLFLTGCRHKEEEGQQASLTDSIQESIADKVLRLHIIADSNACADQEIKLEVKDAVVTYLKPYLADVTTKEAAKEVICSHLDELATLAGQILEEQDFPYSATASLERCYFPVKAYGDLTLPAGEYDALEIRLGNAAGKNWWCLVFPQLCFTDLTYQVLPQDSKDSLKEILTEEEYRTVFKDPDGTESDVPQKSNLLIRFKLLEWLKTLF